MTRLREARRWLRSGGQSVKQAALNLGFNDPKTFTRRFKHHYGINPSDLAEAPLPLAKLPVPCKSKATFPLNQHLLPPGKIPADFTTLLPQGSHALNGVSSRAVRRVRMCFMVGFYVWLEPVRHFILGEGQGP